MRIGLPQYGHQFQPSLTGLKLVILLMHEGDQADRFFSFHTHLSTWSLVILHILLRRNRDTVVGYFRIVTPAESVGFHVYDVQRRSPTRKPLWLIVYIFHPTPHIAMMGILTMHENHLCHWWAIMVNANPLHAVSPRLQVIRVSANIVREDWRLSQLYTNRACLRVAADFLLYNDRDKLPRRQRSNMSYSHYYQHNHYAKNCPAVQNQARASLVRLVFSCPSSLRWFLQLCDKPTTILLIGIRCPKLPMRCAGAILDILNFAGSLACKELIVKLSSFFLVHQSSKIVEVSNNEDFNLIHDGVVTVCTFRVCSPAAELSRRHMDHTTSLMAYTLFPE